MINRFTNFCVGLLVLWGKYFLIIFWQLFELLSYICIILPVIHDTCFLSAWPWFKKLMYCTLPLLQYTLCWTFTWSRNLRISVCSIMFTQGQNVSLIATIILVFHFYRFVRMEQHLLIFIYVKMWCVVIFCTIHLFTISLITVPPYGDFFTSVLTSKFKKIVVIKIC